MLKNIAVGVVGYGYWGPNLVRNFNTIDGCSVRTVCDLMPERLAHLKKMYGTVNTTNSYEGMINDPAIDAIVIATNVSTHFPLAKQSLLAGKHTFIEKPMASAVAQCQELVETAASTQLTLMIGHTFIYSAPVRKIKEIIDSGDIGEILYITARRLNLGLFQKDINVAWDLAPHDISIILHLLGQQPISVNCYGKSHMNSGVEDVTSMMLNFQDETFVTIHSSWLDPFKIREMKIVGSKKMVVYDDTEPLEKIKIYDKRVEVPPHYDTFAEFQYSYHYGDMYSPYIQQYEPLKVEAQHFVDSIRSGTRPTTCGREGMKVIQILEAANQSLKQNGARIEIKNI
jgi:predicted dehydrogenase